MMAETLVHYLVCIIAENWPLAAQMHQFYLMSLLVACDLNGDKKSTFLLIPSAAYSLLVYEEDIRPWQNGTSRTVPIA